MYNSLQLSIKYICYYFTASNGKGHGVHSPFVFDFIRNVLRDKKKHDLYQIIECRRKYLRRNRLFIDVNDPGAGAAVIKSNKRRVSDIAASSLKPVKFSQLLYRLVKKYQPRNIIELGTSFGITTAYLAAGNPCANVITCEGVSSIANLARKGFDELGLINIELVEGNFDLTLPSVLARLITVDLAFVDGNHRKLPTLDYFHQLLEHTGPSSILIFDDIHWSKEMEEAWAMIRQDPSVRLTIDLFFIGIVFFNPDIKIPQHFVIRF